MIIFSPQVRDHFNGKSVSTTELENYVAGNVDKVLASYAQHDWAKPLPRAGVFRIDEIKPEKIFAALGDNDPEYTFATLSGKLLLIVGTQEGTSLPAELKVVEGRMLKVHGHSHPGSEESYNMPSLEDFVALLQNMNSKEFIFTRKGLLTFEPPAQAFVDKISPLDTKAPKRFVDALYYHYIVEHLKLDEKKFGKDPDSYWKKFCTDVFGVKVAEPENALDVIKDIIAEPAAVRGQPALKVVR